MRISLAGFGFILVQLAHQDPMLVELRFRSALELFLLSAQEVVLAHSVQLLLTQQTEYILRSEQIVVGGLISLPCFDKVAFPVFRDTVQL